MTDQINNQFSSVHGPDMMSKMFPKASSNNIVLTHFLKNRREGAWYISMGNIFHSIAATTEKAQFLVVVFWASLGVATCKCDIWLAHVAQVDNLREILNYGRMRELSLVPLAGCWSLPCAC